MAPRHTSFLALALLAVLASLFALSSAHTCPKCKDPPTGTTDVVYYKDPNDGEELFDITTAMDCRKACRCKYCKTMNYFQFWTNNGLPTTYRCFCFPACDPGVFVNSTGRVRKVEHGKFESCLCNSRR